MLKKSKQKWITAGYELFAQEGFEGIQVERLARVLKLNKSGFYHYFQNSENFLNDLLMHHREEASRMAAEIKQCETLDPDYFKVVEHYKFWVLVQSQLIRRINNPLYAATLLVVSEVADRPLLRLWQKAFNLPNEHEVVSRHFTLFRNAFYAQANADNITYEVLHAMMTEADAMMLEIFKHVRGGNRNIIRHEIGFSNASM